MQIKNYSIILESSPQALVKAVTAYLEQGWMPVGGVTTAAVKVEGKKAEPATTRGVWAQAMILPFRPQDAMGIVTGRS